MFDDQFGIDSDKFLGSEVEVGTEAGAETDGCFYFMGGVGLATFSFGFGVYFLLEVLYTS